MGKGSRLLETLPNYLLFFLFVSCMFLALLSGAKVYKNVSNVMEEQFSIHTCVSYVTAKVRHYDREGAVSIGKIGGEDAILLQEEINGEPYVTYLYCSEGYLMELFCYADMKVFPADGQEIMPLDGLEVSLKKGLLSFSCKEAGKQVEATVFLQSGEGAEA